MDGEDQNNISLLGIILLQERDYSNINLICLDIRDL